MDVVTKNLFEKSYKQETSTWSSKWKQSKCILFENTISLWAEWYEDLTTFYLPSSLWCVSASALTTGPQAQGSLTFHPWPPQLAKL